MFSPFEYTTMFVLQILLCVLIINLPMAQNRAMATYYRPIHGLYSHPQKRRHVYYSRINCYLNIVLMTFMLLRYDYRVFIIYVRVGKMRGACNFLCFSEGAGLCKFF